MMKKTFAVAILTAALAACGGKAKPSTTPTPKADDKAGATGGTTYGGAQTPATPAKPPADPCSGGGPM